ncbi:hypothetical protein NCS57_00953800 [Fusarium keratoplasticum]|uniref:Uncharacterized protein n=1 Tax=Fusarium keratoplasticum TaxID=1328300 RepID=A0ACC0QQR6_9HYPO|nr:hypothetical protein NCS57_00953800 [Fusarium keratoplasticum]KAI8663525.1 hypothetical protein NCS57_00953800 [Fusarium keratoplasticum]
MVLTRHQRRLLSARLENLAPELLHRIFACFCLHCHGRPDLPFWSLHEPTSLEATASADSSTYWEGRQALSSLCLVSRRFRDVAQGVLFHEFIIPVGRQPTSLHRRVEPFLRTLASRPDLARVVCTVALDEYLSLRLDVEYAREVVEEALHALGTNFAHFWERRKQCQEPERHSVCFEISQSFILGQLQPGDSSSEYVQRLVMAEILVLLVALLPNLQHLILRDLLFPELVFPAAASALDITRIPLKTLDAMAVPPSILAVAPDLETVHVGPRDSYPKMPSAKGVYFCGHGSDDNIDVKKVISLCSSALSTFSYQTTFIWSSVDQSVAKMLQPRTAVELLTDVCSSLRSLHLDMRFRVAFDRDTQVEPMPSLKQFIVLEELFLTTNSVYNGSSPMVSDEEFLVHLLPQSIQSVTFVDPEFPPPSERLRRGFLGLADARRDNGLFPNLKDLRCDSRQVCDDGEIKHSFSQVGVDFKYQEFPTLSWSYSRDPLPAESPRLAHEAYLRELEPNGPGPFTYNSDEDL